MMQHVCVRCQSLQVAPHAQNTDQPGTTQTAALVSNPADQHISTTCSRRLRAPEEFLDAFAYMQRHHPKANHTTLKIAQDIAQRMPDSKDGHVAYAVASMQKRLGLSRSTVMEHVAILRELGLLCWVEHGSQHNVLRTRLGHRFTAGIGYRGTATIYAPCAPPAYDRAKGRLRDRCGYRSRICGYTPAGREAAIAEARRRSARRTPSLLTRTPYSPARKGEGSKNSAAPHARMTTKGTRRPGSTGVTAGQAALGMAQAQRVRLEIWWTQGSCIRQLAYALRPLLQAGYDWPEIARELTSWQVCLRPTNAVAFIRAELRRRANSGRLHLPEGSVRPHRQAPADETGERHAQMIARRWQQSAAAFARYRATYAGPLRTALRKLASPPASSVPRPRSRLREPEHLFRATLGLTSAAPRDVYRAKAWAQPEPDQWMLPAASEEEPWAELAEHAQAAAAFQRLRERVLLDARESAQRSPTW